MIIAHLTVYGPSADGTVATWEIGEVAFAAEPLFGDLLCAGKLKGLDMKAWPLIVVRERLHLIEGSPPLFRLFAHVADCNRVVWNDPALRKP